MLARLLAAAAASRSCFNRVTAFPFARQTQLASRNHLYSVVGAFPARALPSAAATGAAAVPLSSLLPRCGPRRLFSASGARCAGGQSRLEVEHNEDEDEEPHGVVMDRSQIDMALFPPELVRNFCITAHIDHGKTTLSSRLLQDTGVIATNKNNAMYLDKLEVEKQRGITVKAQTASIFFRYCGKTYLINLIDTPGHVDFTYEVSRSLSACEGALLVVDAAQGVQAQTMANWFLATEAKLTIVPLLNKVDLPHANVPEVTKELVSSFGVKQAAVLLCSAKTGLGTDDILPSVIESVPPPSGDPNKPLRAFLFDSWFTEYHGVCCLVKVGDGVVRVGDHVRLHHAQKTFTVTDCGILYPEPVSTRALYCGQVGYIYAGIRDPRDAHVGDTLSRADSDSEPFPGFRPIKSMVYAGLFPIDNSDFDKLRGAMQRLTLNDAAVTFRGESSVALGVGFRCGFLGVLHMEVFLSRLDSEYGIPVIATSPTVPYKIVSPDGSERTIETPEEFPEESLKEQRLLEPMVDGFIIVPEQYLGPVLTLCQESRGIQKSLTFVTPTRVALSYRLPLAEVIVDFFVHLKEISSGYASFDYEPCGYEPADLIKLRILMNGDLVDPLSAIVHRDKAYAHGRALVEKLKTIVPRQMYVVAIQAAVGTKVIARETIQAYRKDVTSKCYGGDITRKRKLLEKQKEGKKRMKQFGNIELPKEAFFVVLDKKK